MIDMRVGRRSLTWLAASAVVSLLGGCGGCDSPHEDVTPAEAGSTVDAAPPTTDATTADTADAAPPAPAPGGTGSFAVVTAGGKQKLYLPLQFLSSNHFRIAVIDVGQAGNGVAGAPALIKEILLDGEVATATGGDDSIVIAVSTDNRTVRLIDPTTDTVTKTLELPSTFGKSVFPGYGGGVVSGVAVDSAHHRAILSVYDGFQIIDLTTQTLGAHIQAAPSENFGFDSVRGYVVAPFYSCKDARDTANAALPFCDSYLNAGTPMTAGVNVIDLADNTVYSYVNSAAQHLDYPLGARMDSAAVDPTTGLAVVDDEGDAVSSVLDLSKATFDKGTKTFTCPVVIAPKLPQEGVSVEGRSHFAFWEGEKTSLIGVADLSKPLNVFQGTLPDLPAAAVFTTMGDPHGISVATGIADGKPKGFLVSDDRSWVARVDLTTLLGAGVALDGGLLSKTDTIPAVTYLDTTKP
jgi:hypothetical protein